MQCPRCGWHNPLGITACQRCGLAAPPIVPAPHPSYGQPGQQPAAPQPYGMPYASGASRAYTGAPLSSYQGRPAWEGVPTDQPEVNAAETVASSTRLARVLLILAAVASLGYALWAMTARRGIFVDFVDNRSVSLDHARSSDRLDTLFLVVAGGLAVVALALWLIRLMVGRSDGGPLAIAGFVVSGLGIVSVVVGLVLSGLVSNGVTQVDEARRAVTATIVTGSGFIAIAVGLIIGLIAVNAHPEAGPAVPPVSTPRPTPAW